MSDSIQVIIPDLFPSRFFARSNAFAEISSTVMFLKPRSNSVSARFESPPPTSIILASLLGLVGSIRLMDVCGYS